MNIGSVKGIRPSFGLRSPIYHKILSRLPSIPPEIIAAAREDKPYSFSYSDGRGTNWNVNMNRRNYLDEESEEIFPIVEKNIKSKESDDLLNHIS